MKSACSHYREAPMKPPTNCFQRTINVSEMHWKSDQAELKRSDPHNTTPLLQSMLTGQKVPSTLHKCSNPNKCSVYCPFKLKRPVRNTIRSKQITSRLRFSARELLVCISGSTSAHSFDWRVKYFRWIPLLTKVDINQFEEMVMAV